MLHQFTPRNSRLGVRLSMQLNDEDWSKIGCGKPWSATITNQENGTRYKVKGASCGLPRCYCDAVIVSQLPLNAA